MGTVIKVISWGLLWVVFRLVVAVIGVILLVVELWGWLKAKVRGRDA